MVFGLGIAQRSTSDCLAEGGEGMVAESETQMTKIRQKISTFLWFDTQAEEAARFYTSLFENSRIVSISNYPDAVPDRAGTVMLVTFELAGQQFHAMNAGSDNKFTDAISLLVECETQGEIDELWNKLTEGGEERPCGWLSDRFGLPQLSDITPTTSVGVRLRNICAI